MIKPWNSASIRKNLTASVCAFALAAPALMMPAFASTSGWQKTDSCWMYLENGTPVTDTWKIINGQSYLFNSWGALVTGVYLDDGAAYYLTENGLAVNQWVENCGRWYYFDQNGQSTPGWRRINNKDYFFASDCMTQQPGWAVIDGSSYYFSSDGCLKRGWIRSGKGWCYLKSNGTMAAGEWLVIDNYWYYFTKYGWMATGWMTINNSTYFFLSDGKMVSGYVEIDGTGYWFDDSGKLVSSAGGSVTLPETKPVQNTQQSYASGSSSLDGSYSAKVSAFLSDARFANGAWYDGNHAPTFFDSPARGCVAYALDFVWSVFGKQLNPTIGDYFSVDEIRSGDVIRLNEPVHSLVVIERNGNSLYTAEGNVSGQVRVSKGTYTISGGVLYCSGVPVSFAYGAHN